MSVLYTAEVHVKGGREGSIKSNDGRLEARLTFPTALGGNGEGTNPEQLFAAGYGACFAATLGVLAKADGIALTHVEVNAQVELTNEQGLFQLGVNLAVNARGAERRHLETLIEKAKQTCPYSRATRNNVVTRVELVGP